MNQDYTIVLSTDEKTDVCWYVMRAYKTETKVEEKLREYGNLEFFIPKQYVLRTYHGKKTKKLVPVIPSLIFVHGNRDEINLFKQRCELIQYVMLKRSTGLEYLKVPERQMQSFIQVSRSSDVRYYRPEEINIAKGTRVRVHGGGPFDGVEALFVKVNRRRKSIVVLLDGLLAVETEIAPELVEVISGENKN